jgi:hypothetical protein
MMIKYKLQPRNLQKTEIRKKPEIYKKQKSTKNRNPQKQKSAKTEIRKNRNPQKQNQFPTKYFQPNPQARDSMQGEESVRNEFQGDARTGMPVANVS